MISSGAAMKISAGAPPATTKDLKALKKACEQFEAVFAKQLIKEMRKGIKSSPMGDQAGSAIYQDMMDQSIGDSIAHSGSLGIGQMLYKQFAAQVSVGRPAKDVAPVAPTTNSNKLGDK